MVRELGPFDLDPCAAPEPRPWPTAARHYALPRQDGFSLPWEGRVWVNPPYGPETGRWLQRLAEHGIGTALVFARTETEMFHRQVWKRTTGLLFLEGRIHFHYPDGRRAAFNAGAPSVLVAYGEPDAEILARVNEGGGSLFAGHFVQLGGGSGKRRAEQRRGGQMSLLEVGA